MRILACIVAVSTLISACDPVNEPEAQSTRPTFDLGYETSHQMTTTITWQPQIRKCRLDDLVASPGPAEGGAGWAFGSIAFRNVSSTRCRLVEPIALEIVGKRFEDVDITLKRRGPAPYDRPLEPGKRAVLGITHSKCEAIYDHPRMTKTFRIVFPRGRSLEVAYEVPANCGFIWYGRFSDWK